MKRRFEAVHADKQAEAALIFFTCVGLGFLVVAAAVLAKVLGG